MSVSLSDTTQLGINYAVVDNLGRDLGVIGNGSDLVNNSGFNPASLLTVPVSTASTVAGAAASTTAAALAAAGRINGGIEPGGLSSTTDGVKFGFVSKNNSGFFRALETLGDVKVLASPRLLVLNKQKAEIQLGQRLGYQTVTQNLTSTVQQVNFLNTGTLLRLRPFISSDGMIRMELHPERSSGSVTNNLPSSNTAEVTTNVMVPNGATIVIAGLVENTSDYIQTGPLGLHRLPILGIFGNKQRDKTKTELIVLLTPHIWTQNPALAANCPTPLASNAGGKPAKGKGSDPLVLRTSMSLDAEKPASPRWGADGPRVHVVAKGENYWTISRDYYRTGRYYLGLWAANQGLTPTPETLRVGDQIRVPPVEDLDGSLEVDLKTNKLVDGTPVAAVLAPGSRWRARGDAGAPPFEPVPDLPQALPAAPAKPSRPGRP